MAKVKVLNQQGVEVETIDLNDAVFSIEPNNQAMFDAVQVYRSNSRQATSKTKTRAEVRGGGRKPWRQKELDVHVTAQFVHLNGLVVELHLDQPVNKTSN